MLDDAIINYIIIFIILEYFEVSWQRAPSIMGMLLRMHYFYEKNILLFLILHPTYYFAILFAMLCDLHWSALILLFIKTFDIATKIKLIEQVFIKRELSQELALVLLAPIHKLLPYIGIVIYPIFIILALV